MHVSAMEEYGLRTALQLARAYGGEPLASSRIAEREGLSIEYVSKILFLFRKNGLVRAERGAQGGFQLVSAPSLVSLKSVLAAVNSQPATKNEDFCGKFAGQHNSCVHLQGCSVRPVWTVIFSYFDHLLKDLTLADLLDPASRVESRVELQAQGTVKHVQAMIHQAGVV